MATKKAELAQQLFAAEAERAALSGLLEVYMQAMVVIAQTLRRAQVLEEGEPAPALGLDQVARYDAAIEQVLGLLGRLHFGGGAASPLEGALLVVGYSGARVWPREFAIYRADGRGTFEWWTFCELPEQVEALLKQGGVPVRRPRSGPGAVGPLPQRGQLISFLPA